MTVALVGAAKGSPGVTTTVGALAGRWPEPREPFVVELDPSGGDLVVRLAQLDTDQGGLRDTPSTVQLAAASRHGLHPTTILEHTQRLPGLGEIRALVSPSSTFASSTAISELVAANLAACLAGIDAYDVIVDLGTLTATSPVYPLLRAERRVHLVVRTTLESILHTRDLVANLAATGVTCDLIVIGDRPYSPLDAAEAISAEVIATLPDDPVGAAALAGQARNPKILARTRLLRAAGQAATNLASRMPIGSGAA